MTELTILQQAATFVVTVTVPTAGVCYLVIKLTIKGAIADFLTELRKEFVNQTICEKTHALDNQRLETIDEKMSKFERQLEIFLQQKKEI